MEAPLFRSTDRHLGTKLNSEDRPVLLVARWPLLVEEHQVCVLIFIGGSEVPLSMPTSLNNL
jgi:hypothetical protein